MAIVASTTLVNAQAVGGSAGPVLGTQTSANAQTGAFIINTSVVLGAGTYDPSAVIRIWYTASPNDLSSPSATTLANRMNSARYVDIKLGNPPIFQRPGRTLEIDSSLEVLTGAYIYCWVEAPALSPTCTLTIKLQEVG